MNHYEVLELKTTATVEDVKKAYRRLAKIWHPDKNPGKEKEAGDKFKLIHHAYEVLSEPASKERYDSLLGIRHHDVDITSYWINFTTFAIKHPGLLDVLNTENYFKITKQFNLSPDEICFLWFKVMRDHDKILASMNSWDDFNQIPQAADYIFYTSVNNFYEHRKKLIELKIFQKCIKTMDDLVDFLRQPYEYLGSDDFAATYKYTLCNELENNFHTLGLPKKYLRHNEFSNLLYSFGANTLSFMGAKYKKEFLNWLNCADENDQLVLSELLSHCDFHKEQYTFTLYSSSCKSFYSSDYSILLRKNEKSEIEFVSGYDKGKKPSKLILTAGELKILENLLQAKTQVTFPYADYPRLSRRILRQCVPAVKFDKEQFFTLAEALLPAEFKSTCQLADIIKNAPAEIALFVLKKVSMKSFRLWWDKFENMLAWPAFRGEKNEFYRDELSNHLIDNIKNLSEQKYLFFSWFFHFSKKAQAKFLALLEEQHEKNVEYLVYSAWHQEGLSAKEAAMKAIAFPKINLFLMNLPSNVPKQDLLLLANTLIKSPVVLDMFMANDIYNFPSLIVNYSYKNIFKSIESEVCKALALKDKFIEQLDEKINHYIDQQKQESDGTETKTLYADIITIFKTERNQYAVSERNEASKKHCFEAIAQKINQLTVTSTINDNTADTMSRGIYSIGSYFGMCQAPDVTKKTLISTNMHAFMSHPHTRVVKDIVEACELKNAFC